MFYSHTFLARKSPLGTVWIAAHLEHKIKRPQIECINIPSFAEKIMMPDVPIALRLSGHLLVGIVRIFSWKVNHLFLDCNRLVTDIRKSFASVPVDLPKEADTAPFEYVTLPETFDLSALELDESYYRTDEPDRHLKSYDQITMKDQLPMEAEQYIAISIEEDNGLNLSPQQSNGLNQSSPATNELASSSQQANSCSISGKLGDETLPPFDGGFESRFQEHILFSGGVSTENEGTTKKTPDGNNSLQDTLDIEKMLYDPHHSAHGADPYGEIPAGQDSSSIQRRKSLSTIREGGTPNPKGDSYHCAEQLADLSANKLNFPDLEASPAILLPILKPKPSPPVKRQNLKKRKRKLAFDRRVVLSNLQMKKQLDESANIVCKRRKLPGSDLDIWKFQRFSEKEAIFCLPLFSKMDSTLFQSFERSHPSVNNNISTEPGGAEPDKEIGTMIADAQLATPSMDAFSDIERARDADNANDLISQFILNTSSFGSESHKEIHSETILRPSAGISSPVEPISLNLETPLHFKEYQLDDTEIPEAPGLLDSADEDLNFLNANGESPRLHDAFQVENLSARTRAVANYFKDNSLEVQPDRSEPISLNRILQLKSRKQCSRMFYETLVLKSFDFINIQQEEPYGSILIFPTSALLATKF